jgi:D-alanyl-D-alanine carboxypeptidase
VRDLLYAALMQSDDIAAYALAVLVGQDLPPSTPDETPVLRFTAQMNALARKLGMRNTIFVNPSGLEINERRLPYSTATDMALLARYAMNRSQFRFYVSQKEREISIDHATTAPSGYALQNTNELLGIDAIDGVKTGTTHRAGPCLILSAARPPESVQQGTQYIITPRRLVVVVLGAANRFETGHQLLQSGWQAYDQWSAAGRPQKHG